MKIVQLKNTDTKRLYRIAEKVGGLAEEFTDAKAAKRNQAKIDAIYKKLGNIKEAKLTADYLTAKRQLQAALIALLHFAETGNEASANLAAAHFGAAADAIEGDVHGG